MPDSFDFYQYLNHLRRRAPLIGAACLVAVAVAGVVSLLLPERYTSTARILIEPPGSSDPRAAMAVSPTYLDSLRTFEHLASSDSLFKNAVAKLGIRESDSRPLSSLKSAILDVELLMNTKVLEIRVTLADALKAQQLANFIAEETVRVSREANLASDEAQTARIEQLRTEALQRTRKSEDANLDLAATKATDGLVEEIQTLVQTRAVVYQDLLSAEVDQGNESAGTADPERARQPTQARITRLRQQLSDLDKQLAAKRSLLATRTAQRKALESESEAAWWALEQADRQLAAARAVVATRSERLQLIDPGVVPERHSFPNRPLIVVAAFFLALVLSTLYVTLEFSYQQRKGESMRGSFRVAGHG